MQTKRRSGKKSKKIPTDANLVSTRYVGEENKLELFTLGGNLVFKKNANANRYGLATCVFFVVPAFWRVFRLLVSLCRAGGPSITFSFDWKR